MIKDTSIETFHAKKRNGSTEALKAQVLQWIDNSGSLGITNRELKELYFQNGLPAATVEQKSDIHATAQALVAARRGLELEGLVIAVRSRVTNSGYPGLVYVLRARANMDDATTVKIKRYMTKIQTMQRLRDELNTMYDEFEAAKVDIDFWGDILARLDGCDV